MCEKCVERGSKIDKRTLDVVAKYGPKLKEFRDQMMKEVNEEYRKGEPTQKDNIDISGHTFVCMLTGWALSEEINGAESIAQAAAVTANVLIDGIETSRAYQLFQNKAKH